MHGVFNGPLRLTSPVDLNSAPTSDMSRCPTRFRDFPPPQKKHPKHLGPISFPEAGPIPFPYFLWASQVGVVSRSSMSMGCHVLGGCWNFSLTGWETAWNCLFSSRHENSWDICDGNVFDFSGWNDGVDVEWMNGRREVSDSQGTWSPGTCRDSDRNQIYPHENQHVTWKSMVGSRKIYFPIANSSFWGNILFFGTRRYEVTILGSDIDVRDAISPAQKNPRHRIPICLVRQPKWYRSVELITWIYRGWCLKWP